MKKLFLSQSLTDIKALRLIGTEKMQALSQMVGRIKAMRASAQETQQKSTTPQESTDSRFQSEWSECPRHGRYRSYWVDDASVFHFAACPECSRQKFLAQHFALEIPPRFQGMTVTSWQTFNAKMEEVKSAVLAWGEDIEASVKRGKSLIFVGKTGAGKTHLGMAIVMGALRKGFVAKIVDCGLLLSEIYDTYGKDEEGRSKGDAANLIRAYIDLDVLVIDEIGRSPISAHGTDRLFEIIDGRYKRCRPTIVISNLPLASSNGASLTSVLSDAAVSRLRDGGKCLAFDWQDYRTRAKEVK